MAPWFRQGLNGNQHGFQGHHARASMGDAAPKTAHRTASTFGGGHGGFINIARIYGYNDGQGNLTFPTRRAKLFPGDLVAVSNAAGLANGPRSGSGKPHGGSYYGEDPHGHGRGPTNGRPSRGHHGGYADSMNGGHRPGRPSIKEHGGGRSSRGHHGNQAGSKNDGAHRGLWSMGEPGEGRKAHQGGMWTTGSRDPRARGGGRMGPHQQRSDRSAW